MRKQKQTKKKEKFIQDGLNFTGFKTSHHSEPAILLRIITESPLRNRMCVSREESSNE